MEKGDNAEPGYVPLSRNPGRVHSVPGTPASEMQAPPNNQALRLTWPMPYVNTIPNNRPRSPHDLIHLRPASDLLLTLMEFRALAILLAGLLATQVVLVVLAAPTVGSLLRRLASGAGALVGRSITRSSR